MTGKASAHEPVLRAYLEALPADERLTEICLLVGFLAARVTVEADAKTAALLLYMLGDSAAGTARP